MFFASKKPSTLKILSYLMLGVAVIAWIFSAYYILDLRAKFQGTIALLELQLGFVLPIISKFWLKLSRNVLFFGTISVILLLIWKEFRGYSYHRTLSFNMFAFGFIVLITLFADYSIRLPLNLVFEKFSK
jgi:hypothetical protein